MGLGYMVDEGCRRLLSTPVQKGKVCEGWVRLCVRLCGRRGHAGKGEGGRRRGKKPWRVRLIMPCLRLSRETDHCHSAPHISSLTLCCVGFLRLCLWALFVCVWCMGGREGRREMVART